MAYTVDECNEILADLREASKNLASQTIRSANVNGIEYTRNDLTVIAGAIDYWQGQLLIAKRASGDYRGSSIPWGG